MCKWAKCDHMSRKCGQKGISAVGKSMSGPDEIDVIAMAKAIGSLHSGHVELIVRPSGTGFSPSAGVICRITFDVLPGSALPSSVEVKSTWPCEAHRTLAAHLYDGLYRLDFAISKVYKNEELWAT